MKQLCKLILCDLYGNGCKLLSCSQITDGYLNTTLKIKCSEFEKPLFIKIEKPFRIPRTQVFQIKKEIVGINLCKNIDIPVPRIIKFDEDGHLYGNPWILEEYIDKKLISTYQINDDNKLRLGIEYENMYNKISSIKNNFYGDTFIGGYIGQHSSWKRAISQITNLIFEDCMELGVFTNDSDIVIAAIKKAVSQVKSNIQPVLFHCDLSSQNIMGNEINGEVHMSHVIDFGMSLYAPKSYSQYQTWKYVDFIVKPIDICSIYELNSKELDAYDILRMEYILLANIFRYSNYDELTQEYVDKCKEYILN